MAFATDRSLLVLEPRLFVDVVFAGQKIVDGTNASISGTTLTSLAANFVTNGVHAGQVVVVEGVPYEILDVLSESALEISRLRADEEAVALPPRAGTMLELEIVTFDPQITLVHQQVISVIGTHFPEMDDDEIEAALVNVEALTRLEALGALYVIFAGASVFAQEDDSFWQKAKLYEDRFRTTVAQITSDVDLDGDGIVDVKRFVNSVRFVRE